MKVCILSMQRVGNMGSLLQSYALKTTIERLGHVQITKEQRRESLSIGKKGGLLKILEVVHLLVARHRL